MSSLLLLLLHWLHEYGYPVLWLTVFIGAVGFPLPINLALLAVGAIAARGDFNIVLLIGITIIASSCGDNVGYFIGRGWGSRALNWLVQPRRLHVLPARTITRSRLYFKRRGGWAIFFSRFLFSALGGVVNLLAGAERYPYRHFLLYDVTGETLGAAIPLLLGYALGACWEAGSDLLGASSRFAFILFLVILFVSRLLRRKLPHSKETLVAYPAVSNQKLTVEIPLPKSTLQRMTGVRRQNIGEQRRGVPSS
jgi:membrane protein DedA with SNARE-associated domain